MEEERNWWPMVGVWVLLILFLAGLSLSGIIFAPREF